MCAVTLRTPQGEASPASPQSAVSDGHHIFGGYRDLGPYAAAFDEMFDRRSSVRAPYKGIYAELGPTGPDELSARAEALGRAFVDQGITFALSGQEERPFPRFHCSSWSQHCRCRSNWAPVPRCSVW